MKPTQNYPDSRSNHVLADSNIGRLLIRLSLPATIGMFAMAMYNLVDTIFVGRSVGMLGIAGIAIVFPFQMLVLATGQLVGIGGASLISRSIGANDFRLANQALGNIYSLIMLLGIVIAGVGILLMDPLLKIFGATAEILPYSRDYMGIILLGTAFFLFLISSNSIIRAEGRAKIAMGTMLVSAGMNIILDPIFIFVLKMGVKGAAIATVISQFLAAVYIVFFFSSRSSSLHFSARNLRLKSSIIKKILAIGLSAFSRQSAGSLLVIVANNTLAAYGGNLAIAVFGVINRLMRFTMMPVFGIAQGFQPIVGYNYGAGSYPNILKAVRRGFFYATLVSVAGFLLFMLLPETLMSIFSDEPELIQQGKIALRLMSLALPLVGYQVIGATIFLSIGKALPSFLLTMSRQFLFLIPLIVLLPRYLGIRGVWIAFPLSDMLSFLITLFFVIRILADFKSEITRRNNEIPAS